MNPADPIQHVADLPSAASAVLPMWLLFFVIGVRYAFDIVGIIRSNNGKTGHRNGCGLSSDPAFTRHTQVVEQMLQDDPPRKHTDQLTEILGELRLMRLDLRNAVKAFSSKNG